MRSFIFFFSSRRRHTRCSRDWSSDVCSSDPTGETDQAGIKINLNPGDMLIYSGCDLEHWREEFKGKNCGQVFLHYNKANSKKAEQNYLDKRPLLGTPSWFKGAKLTKTKK